ncbi:MAG: tetratricopeptide repeat protein [Candidatus Hydrogenedentales bacterium]
MGYVLLRGYRGQGAYLQAEQAYAEGRWRDAKTNYTWYLARHPGATDVLPKYIDSCLKLFNDRQANVRDAGRAYLQLALASPSDPGVTQQMVDFYRLHNLWRELDYAVDLLLKENPKDQLLAFSKALACDRLGRTTQATAAYQRLVESGNAQPEVYGNLALLSLQQGLEEQGWQVLEKALTDQPKEPRIRAERARFMLAANDVTRAAQEIEAALAEGVDTSEAFLTAAYVYAAQENWEMARTFAEKSVGKRPVSGEGYLLIARSHLAGGRAEEAIAFLSGMDPVILADNPQLYLILAETQIDAGNLEKVDRTAEALRSAYPDNRAVSDYLSARKLLKQGRAAEAVPVLEIVVQQAPELRVARRFLGLAYLQSGQPERAKNTFELYIANNPGDEAARAIWNATFAERSAVEIRSSALELLESHTPYVGSLLSAAISLRGEGSGTQGDGERSALAKRLLERAIEQFPSAPEGYKELAFLCLDQGDLESARNVLTRAEAVGIDPMELSLLRAALALAEANVEQAKDYFDKELANGALAPQRAKTWADLFANRGHLEIGLELLEALQAKEPVEENRRELQLGQVVLHIRFGKTDDACRLIENLTKEYRDVSAMTSRLNDDRMIIARMLLAQGDPKNKLTAEQLTAEVERSEPDRTDAKILRAQILLHQTPADVDGADRLCAAAREAGASDAETFLVSCDVAFRKGHFESALDFAAKAHEIASDDANTSMVLARAQLQMGKSTDAVLTLEKASSLFPENRSILDLLALAYAEAGRISDAEALVQRLEAIEGGQTTAPLRAWMLVARGEWTAAEQLLRKMHEANLDDSWTIHFLAVAMARQDKWDKVEEFLKECVARQPEIPDLWVELGSSYLSESAANPAARLSEASFAFTQALVQQPNYYRALRGLLEVQLRSGNPGAALGLCNRILNDRPDDPDLVGRKAFILAQLPGRQQEALTTIQRAIEIAPKPMYLYLRGYLRLDLKDYANAIEDFQGFSQSGGVAPGNLDLMMAEAYLGLEKVDLARTYYNSAKENVSESSSVDKARFARVSASLEK